MIRETKGRYFWVPRPNMTEEIESLDDNPKLIRINPRELCWVDLKEANRLEEYKNKHEGQPALIVGKGPSLDKLTKQMIPEECIIFACNDASLKITAMDLPNPVYGCQIDKTQLDVQNQDGVIPVTDPVCLEFYENNPKTIVMHHGHYPKVIPVCGTIAGTVAVYMGCSPIVLIAFDGAYGGDCEYAKVIGYSAQRGGAIGRFKGHKKRIEAPLHSVNHKHVFIESSAQKTLIHDTLQQLQDNHLEQCDEPDYLHLTDYTNKSDQPSETDMTQLESQLGH